jgi:hypothetical protein
MIWLLLVQFPVFIRVSGSAVLPAARNSSLCAPIRYVFTDDGAIVADIEVASPPSCHAILFMIHFLFLHTPDA